MASLSFNSVSRSTFELLAEQEELPIYGFPFWMEAAGGEGSVDYATINKGDELVALCPTYHPLKALWLLPPCCQNGGIYFAKAYRSSSSLTPLQFKDRRQAMELLLEQQESVRYAHIALSIDARDALPFYWQGFSLRVRYNYLLSLSNKEKGFEDRVNRLVRRKVNESKKEQCTVSFDLSLDSILPLLKSFYKEKGIHPLFFYTLQRCAEAAISQGKGMIAALFSSTGDLLAVYFIALSGGVGYSMATATIGDISYANTALLYEILIELRSRGCHSFDFEGTMLQGVEPVFRSLGGEQQIFIEMVKGKASLLDRWRLRQHYKKLSSLERNKLLRP